MANNKKILEMRFTGVDLSPNHMGVVTIDGLGHLVALHYVCDTLKGAKLAGDEPHITSTVYKHPAPAVEADVHMKETKRIVFMRAEALNAIQKHGAHFVAIEGYAWDAVGREYQIGEVAGAVKADLWEAGIPFRIHDPTSIKMFVCHNGNASKQDVMDKVHERWGQEMYLYCTGGGERRTEGDLCDAYSLAMMCLVEWRLRNGLQRTAEMDPKELQVFNRTTKANPVNILGREWICAPDVVVAAVASP